MRNWAVMSSETVFGARGRECGQNIGRAYVEVMSEVFFRNGVEEVHTFPVDTKMRRDELLVTGLTREECISTMLEIIEAKRIYKEKCEVAENELNEFLTSIASRQLD